MAVAARALRHDQERRTKPRVRRARRVRVRVAGRGVRLMTLAALPLAFVLAYVWLTAQLTAQTYRLHDAQASMTALTQRDNELRQRVARLESLPRLEAAAAKLHMTVPPGVALLAPAEQAHVPGAQTAIAASLAGMRKWFDSL